jgi:hypothetical protein
MSAREHGIEEEQKKCSKYNREKNERLGMEWSLTVFHLLSKVLSIQSHSENDAWMSDKTFTNQIQHALTAFFSFIKT